MRERRIMLGLTQQQMADLIGVTYQQAHKYEKGINRIAAGRLSTSPRRSASRSAILRRVSRRRRARPAAQQRLLLELARSFIALPSRKHQEAICNLARVLANTDPIGDVDLTSSCRRPDVATDPRSRARQARRRDTAIVGRHPSLSDVDRWNGRCSDVTQSFIWNCFAEHRLRDRLM